MRWFSFFILAYVTLGVQVGLSGYATLGNARPNFVLIVAVFVAMNAPRDAALLGCFLLGLAQDLLTPSPFGLFALEYALLGMFVTTTQDLLYREHFLTHMTLGFVGALLTGLITLIHGWIYPLFHGGVKVSRASIGTMITGAFYTALLAPILLFVLQRMR